LIAQWNLARLGETLLPLFGDDTDAAVAVATEVLTSFTHRYRDHWQAGMRCKLGLTVAHQGDGQLFDDLLTMAHEQAADFTSLFSTLAEVAGGERDAANPLVGDAAALDPWIQRWLERLTAEGRPTEVVAAAMREVNPIYIPRNHLVEEALEAATAGDLAQFEQLLAVVTNPFGKRPGCDRFAEPAPESFGRYFQTFCGT
jgi:uncharacterized protein YdiU (UPF0061 family)